jgi:hypothetical protein
LFLGGELRLAPYFFLSHFLGLSHFAKGEGWMDRWMEYFFFLGLSDYRILSDFAKGEGGRDRGGMDQI